MGKYFRLFLNLMTASTIVFNFMIGILILAIRKHVGANSMFLVIALLYIFSSLFLLSTIFLANEKLMLMYLLLSTVGLILIIIQLHLNIFIASMCLGELCMYNFHKEVVYLKLTPEEKRNANRSVEV